jgi:hypothetical protein
VDGGDAVLDLEAEDGELGGQGVDDLLLELLVVGEGVAEQGTNTSSSGNSDRNP